MRFLGLALEGPSADPSQQLEGLCIGVHHAVVEHLLVDLVGGFLPFFVGVMWVDSRGLLFGGQECRRIAAEGLGMQMGNAFGGLGSFELELHDNF